MLKAAYYSLSSGMNPVDENLVKKPDSILPWVSSLCMLARSLYTKMSDSSSLTDKTIPLHYLMKNEKDEALVSKRIKKGFIRLKKKEDD